MAMSGWEFATYQPDPTHPCVPDQHLPGTPEAMPEGLNGGQVTRETGHPRTAWTYNARQDATAGSHVSLATAT
jgi:hypothetical protein